MKYKLQKTKKGDEDSFSGSLAYPDGEILNFANMNDIKTYIEGVAERQDKLTKIDVIPIQIHKDVLRL